MVRYSLAAAFISLIVSKDANIIKAADAHDGHDDKAWSYLPVTVPTPLSDMSITVLTVGGGDNSTATSKRIIITGGCDNPEGNEFVEEDWGAGFSCNSLSSKAYAFDPIRHSSFQAWTGEFETLADMPRTRNRHASAVVNGNTVCVFGGRDVTDSLIAEVDCYNADTNEWSTPTSLPEQYQSSDFTAFVEGDTKVHLVGGYNAEYTALDQVTVVDMSNLGDVTYSDGSKLGEKRGDIDVAVLDNGHVYVSGGFTHENDYAAPKNTVEKYSPASQTWSDVDSLNQERGDKQLVALNGKIYAIGGEAKVDVTGVAAEELPELGARSEVLDSVEVLDPEEDIHGGLAQWKNLAGMPGQLFRFAASEWEVEGDDEDDGFIFVFGGQVGYDSDCKCFRTTDKVMVFDVSHAEKDADEDMGSNKALGSGAGMMAADGGMVVRMLSFIAAGLFWFTL
eukprot:CAMPEP_0172299166 /NCGR_PEP_ID=MMETSP1058-20130122/1523_1 /TAXON_ID=83371 /ORGANISM="Detonula confervacea, Strain CCMP 353" /LENGTH=449 /DNA_ID=CAMNT_0013008515 /DNA_START=234 /DNA_END=1583 /DNA_ORIENTATION=+